MKEEAHYFRIGLFIIVAFVILVAGIMIFGAGKIFQRRIYFETYMTMSVQGIEAGSAVKFRGVPIGKVSSIDFLFNEYANSGHAEFENYVVLELEITEPLFPGMFEKDISPLLTKAIERGLRARVEPVGVTGVSYVEIDYVDAKQFPVLAIDWKPRYYYIPSAPGQLTNILDSVNNIMRDFGEMNFEGISQELTGALRAVNASLEEVRLERLSQSTDAALIEIRGAAAALKGVMKNLEPVTKINGDDVDITFSNLRIISDNFRELSADLKRNPSRLLFGGPPQKPDVLKRAAHKSRKGAEVDAERRGGEKERK